MNQLAGWVLQDSDVRNSAAQAKKEIKETGREGKEIDRDSIYIILSGVKNERYKKAKTILVFLLLDM